MKYTVENTRGSKVIVKDVSGNIVPFVLSYDDETKEAELLIPIPNTKRHVASLDDVGRPSLAKAKVMLRGSTITVEPLMIEIMGQ